MKRTDGITLSLLFLPACGVFGGLTEQERKDVREFTVRAGKYFDARNYRKAIDQADAGLDIDSTNYELRGRRAWSYLQLSMQTSVQNDNDLRQAEQVFGAIIPMRDDDEHEPRNILGYAITLHNRARVEENRAKLLRKESENPAAKEEAGQLSARADEHERRARSYDVQAHHYFKKIVDGGFARSALQRIAYKYLMALEYRQKHYKAAFAYGAKNLALNEKEVTRWKKEYQLTKHADREPQLRKDLFDLQVDELKVRARMAAYYREMAEKSGNEDDYLHAIAQLDVILRKRPNRYQDYYLRGACHRALQHHKAAQADFRTFLQLGKLPQMHESVRDAYEYLYGRK